MARKGYIDRGDRVVIVGNSNWMGSSDLSQYQGKHGTVLSNDGWGLCCVLLDDGNEIYAWNASDLKREK